MLAGLGVLVTVLLLTMTAGLLLDAVNKRLFSWLSASFLTCVSGISVTMI